MLAITTRFHGPTNTKGSRITASVTEEARDGQAVRKVTIGCEDALGLEANHRAAAVALIRKLGWTSPNYGDWIAGDTPTGYVFVCDTRHGHDRMTVEAA